MINTHLKFCTFWGATFLCLARAQLSADLKIQNLHSYGITPLKEEHFCLRARNMTTAHSYTERQLTYVPETAGSSMLSEKKRVDCQF